MIGFTPRFSKVWLLVALAVMPLLTAMECGRFLWSFSMYPPSPIWSSDQSKIVFNSGFGTLQGQMHIVDSDGSNLLSFPHKSGEYATGISPDGVIVFTEFDLSDDGLFGLATPGYQVHTAMLDGSGRRRLAKGGQDYHYASWSPSGEMIAFSAARDGLYIMRRDGSAKKKLVNNDILHRHSPITDLVYTSPVSWSPDGSKLAFLTKEKADTTAIYPVYTVTVDGLNFTRLSPASSLPAWSPDGKRIAFVRVEPGSEFRYGDDISTIYTINSDGGDLRAIASFAEEFPLGFREGKVSWSKDGSQIRLHQGPFVTVNVDGSNLRMMDGCGLLAEWSPDESLIAVYTGALLTMTPGGSDIRLLAQRSSDGWSAAGNAPAADPYVIERCKWTEVPQ